MLRAERSSYHYRGRGADQADLKKRIREIPETRVRHGYRRIRVLLRREGWAINGKRVYRLCKELGLQLRKKAQAKGEGEVEGRPVCGQTFRIARGGAGTLVR